jgi:hypothetical protein
MGFPSHWKKVSGILGLWVGPKGYEIQVADEAGALYQKGVKLSGVAVANGTQHTHVADPTGGTTTDAEARTAINAILAALETFGINASS